MKRGLLAGAFGGLVGSVAKVLGEAIFPPRSPGEPLPPAVLADKISRAQTGHPVRSEAVRQTAVQGFHWGTGMLAGAMYGLLAEVFPVVRVGHGVGFGVVLLLCTHESSVPLLGLSAPPQRLPAKEHLSELFTHSLYALTVEAVRCRLRGS